jgi:hypothetical protein
MMNFLRKHTRIIFIVTIVAFIGTSFAGFFWAIFSTLKTS